MLYLAPVAALMTTFFSVSDHSNVASVVRQPPICAIDMGSNTFRRIVGSFQDGRYLQRGIERVPLGVGDDVTRNGRISDKKLGEIELSPRSNARVIGTAPLACSRLNRRVSRRAEWRTDNRNCQGARHRHGDRDRETRIRTGLSRGFAGPKRRRCRR